MHHTQREAQDESRKDAQETKDLLLKILTSRDEVQRIAEMESRGEEAAESIMEAGQKVSYSSSSDRLCTLIVNVRN